MILFLHPDHSLLRLLKYPDVSLDKPVIFLIVSRLMIRYYLQTATSKMVKLAQYLPDPLLFLSTSPAS
jgi:hypothetical protein